MNAPYDGDRGQGAGADPSGQAPPPHPGSRHPRDPRVQDPRQADPRDPEPYGQDGSGPAGWGHGTADYGPGTTDYGHNRYPPEGHAAGGYPPDAYGEGGYPADGYSPDGGPRYTPPDQSGYPAHPYPPASHQPRWDEGGARNSGYQQDGYPAGGYPGLYDQEQYPDPYGQGHGQRRDGYGPGGYYQQDGYGQGGYPQDPYGNDPYGQGGYSAYPYPGQDPAAQDPVSDALHDWGVQQPHGGQPATGSPYPQQPPQGPYSPDPQHWGAAPASDQPSGYPDYSDPSTATHYLGFDDLSGHPGGGQPRQDAFAHLFRDQDPRYGAHPYQTPDLTPAPPTPTPGPGQDTAPTPEATAPAEEGEALAKKATGGKATNLLKSSALMAAGTLVSRLTGFLRTLVITAALGAALLGDTYQIAFQLPTMVFYLTIGGGLNSVFVPQLVRAMKDDDDGGEAYANRLLTLVIVALGALVAVAVFAAPALVRILSPSIANNPAANDVSVTFARYCLPTIFFTGIHVVMGQILNARGRFGAMMWTPVLNNIVVIFSFGMFIWVYGTSSTSKLGVTTIPPEGLRLLGIGTLLGLVVQALAMVPYLREAGFHFRLRFDWRGHGLGKAAKLARWTVLFVLANQAGGVAVTQLATSAGMKASDQGHDGTGILAYSNAQLIWGMPQAIITVSVMAALLPRISRAAADDDSGAVRDDISQGLRTSAVAIVPIAFAMVALGIPLCTLMYSSSGTGAARSMGFILMAFGLGLIPYSVQYVVLRGFYAYEDTRTPFYNTVIVAAVNAGASALCFLVLPARWAVVGMAASYGLAYAAGVGVAWRRLRRQLGGDLDGRHVVRTYTRLAGAALPAAILGGLVGYVIMNALGGGVAGAIVALITGGGVLGALFFVAAKKMRVEELTALVGMVRGRLGR